jgi:hypothetical protein
MDLQIQELRASLAQQLENEVYTLNDKIWVLPYAISCNRSGLDLFSLTGVPLRDLYDWTTFEGHVPLANVLRSVDMERVLNQSSKDSYNDPTNFDKAYCFFAPIDGCHRLYILADFLFNGLPNGKKVNKKKYKNLMFTVNILVPKDCLDTQDAIRDRAKDISIYFADITRKGKGHTFWDSVHSCFNILKNTLPENANNNGLKSRFLGRNMPCKVHKGTGTLNVPGFVFSTDQKEVFAGLTTILPDLLLELLKFDYLALDWKLHHKLKADEDMSVPVNAFRDNAKAYTVLSSLVTFIGSERCKQYIADSTHVARFRSTGIDLPYSILQLLHLFVTASMSEHHLMSIHSYLEDMMKNNTLTLERLLTMIAYADDIVSNDDLLLCNRHAKHSKKIRKVFHGGMVMSMLRTYSLDETNFQVNLNELHKHKELCGYLRSYSPIWYTRLLHDPIDALPTNCIRWHCEKDIFLTLYTTYIQNTIGQTWFHTNERNFILPLTRQLHKTTKLTIDNLSVPDYLEIRLPKDRKTYTIPLSMFAAYEYIFNSENVSRKVDPTWRLSDFEEFNEVCFNIKSKKLQKTPKKTSKADIIWNYGTHATDYDSFKSYLFKEYLHTDTTKTRRLCLATAFVSITAQMESNETSFQTYKNVVDSLDDDDCKPAYPTSTSASKKTSKKRVKSDMTDDDFEDDNDSESSSKSIEPTVTKKKKNYDPRISGGIRTITLADVLDSNDEDDE